MINWHSVVYSDTIRLCLTAYKTAISIIEVCMVGCGHSLSLVRCLNTSTHQSAPHKCDSPVFAATFAPPNHPLPWLLLLLLPSTPCLCLLSQGAISYPSALLLLPSAHLCSIAFPVLLWLSLSVGYTYWSFRCVFSPVSILRTNPIWPYFISLFWPFLALLSPFLLGLFLSYSKVCCSFHSSIFSNGWLYFILLFFSIFHHLFRFLASFILGFPLSQVCPPLLWDSFP